MAFYDKLSHTHTHHGDNHRHHRRRRRHHPLIETLAKQIEEKTQTRTRSHVICNSSNTQHTKK